MSTAATLLLSSGEVLAGDAVTVAVLGIETGEGVPDSAAVAVTDALRQRVSLTPGYRLVQGRDLVEVKLVFSCPDEAPPCMGQAAKSLGASRLIFGTVKKAGGDAYNITIKLFDGNKEVVESWTSDQFPRAQADGPALRGPVQKWIATLTGQSMPGSLRVAGGVVGASVAIDGVGAGVLSATGLTIAGVAAGKHEITVTKPGYAVAKKSVTLGSGDTRDVAIEMVAERAVPVPAITPVAETPAPGLALAPTAESAPAVTEQAISTEPSESRTGTRVGAWLTLASGVAGIAIGIHYSILVSQANDKLDPYRRFACTKQSNGKPAPTGFCDIHGIDQGPVTDATYNWMKDTKARADNYEIYQWIGYGVGGAMLLTSAVFFYHGYVSRSSPAVADARGSSFQVIPMLAPNAVGAAASATF